MTSGVLSPGPGVADSELLAKLTPEQRAAVTTTEGPLLVLSGAGSGKTRVICHRIAWLLHEGNSPRSIFTVTFTNKAAAEMVHRVRGLSEREADRLWVSTFHSAAARMLRRDADAIGRGRDFTIYDEGDSAAIVKDILKELQFDPKLKKPSTFVERISRAKDELKGPDEWMNESRLALPERELTYNVYKRYEERLKRANALDFGDLLVEAVRLLQAPAILEKYHDLIKFVMVDEYQDTNHAQYRMVHLLAAGTRNLCVVGDDDQSIYEWRGADRRNILEFTTDFPDAKVVELFQNFRSTQPILDAAGSLINHNRRLRVKNLFTDRKDGAKPVVRCANNEFDEMDRLVDDLKAARRKGVEWKDNAIFYRVHAQSRIVEEMLSAAAIPYQILNGISFYQRAEIKDMIAYLRALANPHDDVSVARIANRPARGIGDTTLAALKKANLPLFEAMKRVETVEGLKPAAVKKIGEFVAMMERLMGEAERLGVGDLIEELLRQSRYAEQYKTADPEDEDRLENVKEFYSAAVEFQESSMEPTLTAFLERISLASDADGYDPERDAVVLTTLHSAKGLEFRHVFIVGCEETLFPHARVLYDENEEAALEEERRLAYVGFTRAKESLTLSYALARRIYGKMTTNRPSRFLRESGLVEAPVRSEFFDNDILVTRVMKAPEAPVKKKLPEVSGVLGAFSEGDRVKHVKFGLGTVLYVSDAGDENEVVQIRFPVGVKSLMTRYANLNRI